MAKFHPIHSGTLRDVCQIQTRVDTTSATGDWSGQTYTTDSTHHRCHIEPIIGSEHMAAMQLTADLTHVLTMRPVTGLTTKNRLLVNSARTFEIVQIIDSENRLREWVLLCKELV